MDKTTTELIDNFVELQEIEISHNYQNIKLCYSWMNWIYKQRANKISEFEILKGLRDGVVHK